MKRSQLLSFKLLQFIIFAMPTIVFANDGAENYQTVKPKFREFIVEVVHPLEVAQYLPATKVSLIKDKNKSNFGSPEKAFQAYISAMSAFDYDWLLSTWTTRSQQLMRDTDKKTGRTSADWQRMWLSQFPATEIELLTKIKYGTYVLLHFKMKLSQTGKIFEDTIALTQEQGKWQLTQELSQEAVLSNWNNQAGKVRVPASTWSIKNLSMDTQVGK